MNKLYPSMVLKVAIGELGYHEKASNAELDSKTANSGSKNYTKYARDLFEAGYYNGNKQGFAWCDVGFDWCVYMACGKDKTWAEEVTCQTGDCGAGVDHSRRYYKQQNRCDRNPKVGDQVFFGKGGEDHTGLLEAIEGNTLTVIEFNKDNQVKRCRYDISDPYVFDFGHPFYDDEPDNTIIRYNTVEECPAYSRPTIQKLVDNGYLSGHEFGLYLTEDMIRIFVVNDNAGLYNRMPSSAII